MDKCKSEYDANRELKKAREIGIKSDDNDYFSWRRRSIGPKAKKTFRIERQFKIKQRHQH